MASSTAALVKGEKPDPALGAFPHTIVNWAQPGRAMAAFKRAGISDALLLGGYRRPSFLTARPDLAFLRLAPAVVKPSR